MNKVVIQSDKSIQKKIEKELSQQNRLTKEQNSVYADITYLERTLELKEEQRSNLTTEIQFQEDEITKIEQKLEGIDHFLQYKIQLTKLEADQKIVKTQIDDIETNTKEKLINVWMLNGCTNLIKAAEDKLSILNREVQERQEHHNPVPMNLPGPEYVEQMLKDKVCYICERPVEENTEPFEALKKRLNDFEQNVQIKLLQENFTDLNRFRKKLLSDLPHINTEITTSEKNKNDLIKKRNALGKQINNVFSYLGFDQRSDLETNANTAQQSIHKLKTYRADISIKSKRLNSLENEITQLKLNLHEKKQQRDGFTTGSDNNIVENVAADYIALFLSSITKLKDYAYKNLITELELESNRLYTLYLDGREQGSIKIDKGVHVVDVQTGNQLIDLNMGEQVAQKLAVANAFLSLSARKMNRSYPLIADAPSSDLDALNTYALTVNIGKSFDQIIIMSKDYVQFKAEELSKLIDDAGIERFYLIKNEYIDPSAGKSRTNRQSIATQIK